MALSLLVLTDFFQPAKRALDYAATLVAATGGHLVLLHVHRDSVLDPDLLTGTLEPLDNQAINQAFENLTRHLTVPVVAEVGFGQVAEAIAAAVSRHRPDLLVLGRPDTEDLPDELIATTALDILRSVPYPMLVVPPAVRQGHVPRQVLLAVDGEIFTLGEHAGSVHHLFNALHAELTVLHITNHNQNPQDNTAKALDSVLRTGLALESAVPVRIRSVVAAHPAEAIIQAAQPASADLVALIARPRSFWGQLFHHSVTAQVLLHSIVPVLVLPAQEQD